MLVFTSDLPALWRQVPRILTLCLMLCLTLCPAVAAAAEPAPISTKVLPRFAPPRSQAVESPALVRLLDDPALARRLLLKGEVVKRQGRYLVKPFIRRNTYVLFRVTVKLPGGGEAEVLFKPRQADYRDWATEIAACRLARHLGVVVPPCAERTLHRKVLAAALAKVPAHCQQRLRWRGDSLYGFFRVWAPGFRHRIGEHRTTRANLLTLAAWLHPRNRARVLRHPLLRRLPGLNLLDYLIYNDDRQWNLGTIRTGAKTLRLFPIDFGEGLSSGLSRRSFSKRIFRRTSLFPARVVKRLERLDRAALRRLLRGPDGLLVGERHVGQVLVRRKLALEHVQWATKELGKEVLF